MDAGIIPRSAPGSPNLAPTIELKNLPLLRARYGKQCKFADKAAAIVEPVLPSCSDFISQETVRENERISGCGHELA
jgi:hypothetical protein